MSIDPALFTGRGDVAGLVSSLIDLDRRLSTVEAARTFIGAGTIQGALGGGQIAADTITATEILTGNVTAESVLTTFLNAGNISTKYITAAAANIDKLQTNSIATQAITADRLAATLTISSTIQTGAVGSARVVLDTNGIRAYAAGIPGTSDGAERLRFDVTTGSLTVAGIVTAMASSNIPVTYVTSGNIVSGTIITIDSGGRLQTAASYTPNGLVVLDNAGLRTYNSSGALTADVNQATSTFTGGTFQTAAPGGARVVMDSTGFHATNSSGATIADISATTSTFTGATFQTASGTGARVVLDSSGLSYWDSTNTQTVFLTSARNGLSLKAPDSTYVGSYVTPSFAASLPTQSVIDWFDGSSSEIYRLWAMRDSGGTTNSAGSYMPQVGTKKLDLWMGTPNAAVEVYDQTATASLSSVFLRAGSAQFSVNGGGPYANLNQPLRVTADINTVGGSMYSDTDINATNYIKSNGYNVARIISTYTELYSHSGWLEFKTDSTSGSHGAYLAGSGSGGFRTTGPLYGGNALSWSDQSSWYITGHGTYGLITNTGLVIGGTCTAVNFVATSDLQYKTNVETVPDALERLGSLRGVSYWEDDGRGIPGPRLGVIAQEVENVFPEAVQTTYVDIHGRPDKRLGVEYNGLIAPMIEGINELADRVASLEIALEVLATRT